MRILIVGGTRFVGRHIAQAAIERGHDVTLFHRGVTNPQLFPEAKHVHGDRHAGGLSMLGDRRFDAIVDSSAYFPADVEAAAAVAAERYVLISSGSVYRDPVAPGSDEDAPTYELDGPIPATIESPEVYGALKVLCERAAEARFPGRTLVLRSGLVVGPHDHTERFSYWPRRVARGGPVLAAEPDQPAQFIDARDLGSWAITAVEDGTVGVFNAVGPAQPLTMAQLLATCIAVTGSDAQPVWAGDRFLLEQGVEPWGDLPLWLPADVAGFLAVDSTRGRSAGLRTRPPAETIADVLRWDAERDPAERRDAMPIERERELLALHGGKRNPA
jgi:2'-hydroxyisoflavone reductase